MNGLNIFFRNRLKIFVLGILGRLISQGHIETARILSLSLRTNSFTPKLLNFIECHSKIANEASEIRRKIQAAKLTDKEPSMPVVSPIGKYKYQAYFIHPGDNSVTSEVVRNLSDSFSRHVGKSFLVLDDESEIEPSVLSKENMKIDAKEKLLFFFELHSLIKLPLNSLISKLEILQNSNIHIFILCFDVWRETDRDLIDKWRRSRTTFLHMDHTISNSDLQKRKNLMHWFFVGHFIDINRANVPEKKIFFSGNIKTSDRRAWLLNLVRASNCYQVSLDLRLFSYKRRNRIRQTYKEFIESMSSSMFIFGLSQKSDTQTLITFRSVEALALGRVLIQQELPDSRPLLSFFTPYFEYLPFESPEELGAYLYLIGQEPSLFIEIGPNALKKWNDLYSPQKLWDELISSINA